MKKILVTGGTGFIGTNISKYLNLNGYEVRATYHSAEPKYKFNGIEYIKVDLLNVKECLTVMDGVDMVIMCAAYSAGIESIREKPLFLLNECTKININTLDAAYQKGVESVIYISSGAVYPILDHAAKEEEGFVEDPINKYFALGWSKRYGEILCKSYADKIDNAINVTVLRVDNVYGPYDNFDGVKAHVIPSLIRKTINDNSIIMWGDGNEQKDFLYIEDLVKAVFLCMHNMGGFQVYNVVKGENLSLNDALDIIIEETGLEKKELSIKHDLSKPTSISNRNLSNEKISSRLGYKAETDFRDGISKTICWYKEEYYGNNKNTF